MQGLRRWANDGFSMAGWEGAADEAPPWTATIVASWTPRTFDRWRFLAGVTLAGAALSATVYFVATGGLFAAFVLAAGTAFIAWDLAQAIRSRRPSFPLTIELGPEALRLTSAQPDVLAVVLMRTRAGWLVSQQTGENWHRRVIALVDDQERPVAQFMGDLARVRVASGGDLVPSAANLPDQIPVSVLLGCWWPHPARRMTRQGQLAGRFRWREPDIAHFPGYERRQRLILAAIIAFFGMLLSVGAGTDGLLLGVRIAAAVGAIATFAMIARILLWRPRFIGQQ